jgi:hypothetical protein
VLDRYQELYIASRTDPERPFTDEKLIADFREVAEQDELASLVVSWEVFRNADSAVRLGQSNASRPFLTAVTDISPAAVETTYCMYDDAVTYSRSQGTVLSDRVVVNDGVVGFALRDGRWLVTHRETVESEEVQTGSPDPCVSQRIA